MRKFKVSASSNSSALKVTPYVINKGQSGEYYGLKIAEDNQVLPSAPNNWKSKKGAIAWAKKKGYEVVESSCGKKSVKANAKLVRENEYEIVLEDDDGASLRVVERVDGFGNTIYRVRRHRSNGCSFEYDISYEDFRTPEAARDAALNGELTFRLKSSTGVKSGKNSVKANTAKRRRSIKASSPNGYSRDERFALAGEVLFRAGVANQEHGAGIAYYLPGNYVLTFNSENNEMQSPDLIFTIWNPNAKDEFDYAGILYTDLNAANRGTDATEALYNKGFGSLPERKEFTNTDNAFKKALDWVISKAMSRSDVNSSTKRRNHKSVKAGKSLNLNARNNWDEWVMYGYDINGADVDTRVINFQDNVKEAVGELFGWYEVDTVDVYRRGPADEDGEYYMTITRAEYEATDIEASKTAIKSKKFGVKASKTAKGRKVIKASGSPVSEEYITKEFVDLANDPVLDKAYESSNLTVVLINGSDIRIVAEGPNRNNIKTHAEEAARGNYPQYGLFEENRHKYSDRPRSVKASGGQWEYQESYENGYIDETPENLKQQFDRDNELKDRLWDNWFYSFEQLYPSESYKSYESYPDVDEAVGYTREDIEYNPNAIKSSTNVYASWYEGGDIVMYFNGKKVYEGQPGADMYDAILPLCQDDETRLKFQEWCNQFGDPLFDDEYGDASETAYTFCELIYYNFVDDENNYDDGNGILDFEIFPATEEVTGTKSVNCASAGMQSYDIYEVADPDGNIIEAFDSYEEAEAYANSIIKDTGVGFYDIFHVVAPFYHESGKWGDAEIDELVGQVMASTNSVNCASDTPSAKEYNQILADKTLDILHKDGYETIGCAVTDEALSFFNGTEDDVVYIQPTDEITPVMGDEDSDAEELATAVKNESGQAVEATTYDDLEPITGEDEDYGYGFDSNGDAIDESTVDELYRIAEREILPTTELAKVDEYATIMEDTFEFYMSSPYVDVTYTIRATFDTDDIDVVSYALPDAIHYDFRGGKEVGELEFYIYVKGSEIEKIELIWNSSNIDPDNYNMEAIESYVKDIAKPAAEAIYNGITNL